MWVNVKVVEDLSSFKSQLSNKLERIQDIKVQFDKDITRMDAYINMIKILNYTQACNILNQFNLTSVQMKNILRSCTQGIFFENFEFASTEYKKDNHHVVNFKHAVFINVYSLQTSWFYSNIDSFKVHTIAIFQIIDPDTYDSNMLQNLIQSSNYIDWDENKSYLEIIDYTK
jgi:hypothetical protein